jgi:hypothetical protein
MGFHDVEHGELAPGVKRVLLLGDSYVESFSVPQEEVLGQRLEHHLNAAGQGRWEVVSIGRAGWCQRDELTMIRRWGRKVRPDVVLVLFLSLNDVGSNSAELYQRPQNQFRDPNRLSGMGWTQREADDASYFSERLFLKLRAEARKLSASFLVAAASTPEGVLGAEAGLEAMMESYPAMRGREWDLDMPDRRLGAFLEGHDIPFTALQPAFRAETARGRELHWRYDGHWNREGHELAAFILDPE